MYVDLIRREHQRGNKKHVQYKIPKLEQGDAAHRHMATAMNRKQLLSRAAESDPSSVFVFNKGVNQALLLRNKGVVMTDVSNDMARELATATDEEEHRPVQGMSLADIEADTGAGFRVRPEDLSAPKEKETKEKPFQIDLPPVVGSNAPEGERLRSNTVEDKILLGTAAARAPQLPPGTRVQVDPSTPVNAGPSLPAETPDTPRLTSMRKHLANVTATRLQIEELKRIYDSDSDEEGEGDEKKIAQRLNFEADQEDTDKGAFGHAETTPINSGPVMESTPTSLSESVTQTATPGGRSGAGSGVQEVNVARENENQEIVGVRTEDTHRGGPLTNELHDTIPNTSTGTSANTAQLLERLLEKMYHFVNDNIEKDQDLAEDEKEKIDPTRNEDEDGVPVDWTEPSDVLRMINAVVARGDVYFTGDNDLLHSVAQVVTESDIRTGEAASEFGHLLTDITERDDSFFDTSDDSSMNTSPPPPNPINLNKVVSDIYNEVTKIHDLLDNEGPEARYHGMPLGEVVAYFATAADTAKETWQNETNFNTVLRNSGTSDQFFTSEYSSRWLTTRVRADVPQAEEDIGKFMFWWVRHTRDASEQVLALKYAATGPPDMWSTNRIWWTLTGGNDASHFDFTGTDIDSNGEYEVGDIIDKVIQQSGTQAVVDFPPRNEQAAISNTYIGGDGLTDFQRSIDRAGEGRPSAEINLPDPRFSERGGKLVPNTYERQIKNPKYDPRLKPGDKGYEPPFITQTLPDIGLGSKDNARERERKEADRLLQGQPVKLYAPIHAQSVDRYLGKVNYARLGLRPEEYLHRYCDLRIAATDITSLFQWNVLAMMGYGPMLYAFVNDAALQRNLPKYPMENPEGVRREFMELYELIKELASYESNAPTRTERVADAAGGGSSKGSQNTLSQQLEQYERQRAMRVAEQGFGPEAVVIQTSGNTDNTPSSTVDPNKPTPPPLPPSPVKPVANTIPSARTSQKRSVPKSLTFAEVEYGISSRPWKQATTDDRLLPSPPPPPRSRRDTGNGRPYNAKEFAGEQGVSTDERMRLFRALGGRL